MRWTHLARWIAVCLTATFAPVAAAVTIGFDDMPGGSFITDNIAKHGYRFSPNCHVDIGWYMNVDDWACHDEIDFEGIYNRDFLGPDEYRQFGVRGVPAVLWIDREGELFNLESFVALVPPIFEVRSSNGGVWVPGLWDVGLVSFTGLQWRNVEWLLLFGATGNIQGIDFSGFDDITLTSVPEPSALALLGLLFALGFSRQRAMK